MNTPLHKAVYNGHNEVVQILIKRGADLKAKERTMNLSAAHMACLKGHAEVLQSLIEAKADLATTDSLGASPLHLASQGEKESHTQCVQLLLDAGVDVRIFDDDFVSGCCC